MDYNDRLLVKGVKVTLIGISQLVVLLHFLKEEGCVQAEVEYLLEIGHVVVHEGELANRERADRVLRVLVLLLSAEVVNLDHLVMLGSQELHNIALSISVETFESTGREAARNYPIRDVSQIKVVITGLEPALVGRDESPDPVAGAA